MENFAMGWVPDPPDFRDLSMESKLVSSFLTETKGMKSLKKGKALGIPATVDLRSYCSPIENQGGIGSCTANAGVGLVEYFERRAYGRHLDASRLFLYKSTRNLLHWTGDTGAYLRKTMQAMVVFGICPEEYWPYSDAVSGSPPPYDAEPSAFCYSFAQNYQALKYYRLDTTGMTRPQLLLNVKNNLAAGLPSMFGFTVYSSYGQSNSNGGSFPYPQPGERVSGGHAVVAIGYDDGKRVQNISGGAATVGALLIRNSWGSGWGTSGYGWLPYQYILSGQAVDFWSLVKNEYLNTGNF